MHDAFAQAVFGDTPLGRPVLGTRRVHRGLSRTTINGYYRRHYRPQDMVVAAAGNVDHARSYGWSARRFAGRLADADPDADPAPRRGAARRRREPGVSARAAGAPSRPTSCSACPGVAAHDERRFALGVLNAALGGGMSSRLFQEVREKRGLAYSVYSYTRAVRRHRAVRRLRRLPARARSTRCSTICRDELAKVAADGITAEELRPRQGPAARRRWSSAWRTPARG